MPSFLPKLNATLSNNSMPSPHLSNAGHSSGTNNIANTGSHPFELSIDLESPPIILYGPPKESSGSLISGQLQIDITKDTFVQQRPSSKKTPSSNTLQTLTQTLSNLNLSPSQSHSNTPPHSMNNSANNLMALLNVKDHVLVNSVQLALFQRVHYAKPFLPPSNTLANCASCKNKSTELARWDIMTQSHNLPLGKHSYPFSHLIPGSLPATNSLGASGITTIKYELVAVVSYNNHNNQQTVVKVVLPLNVSRSVLRGPDRNSLRVFPPTEVTATSVLPNVIHPKSSFALELKLEGVATDDRRWRMRRVGWRIEELVKMKAAACANHKTKLKVVEEHYRKNPHLSKNPVKRNQQSGPTTSFSVTTQEELEPARSATGALSAQQTRDADAVANDTDTISNSNLHPSDHANDDDERPTEMVAPKKEDFSLYSQEVRTVASGDLRNGWKSDFSGKGKIELVAEISCFGLSSAAGPHLTHVSSKSPIEVHPIHPTVSCDVDDPVLGITSSHVLIVEVVIAEEMLQNSSSSSLTASISHPESQRRESSSKPDQRLAELSPMFANHVKPTLTEPVKREQQASSHAVIGVPTGSARVLRMQFKLNVTERSGLGIAWDDEVPPMYDDVSALSPPTYDNAMSPAESPSEPPLYPLNPAHTHSHPHGTTTPGVIYGIGNTPMVTPRQSSNFQSLHGALEADDFTLN